MTTAITTTACHTGSASKTDLLLRCAYWASSSVRVEPQSDNILDVPDVPRFGVAFHKCLELHLNRVAYAIPKVAIAHGVDPKRLEHFVRRGTEFVTKLLRARKWEMHQRFVEKKIAYDPFNDRGRWLATTGTRDYSGRLPTELPGTIDLALRAPSKPLVLFDWKTGETVYPDADENQQLRTLATALHRLFAGQHTECVSFIVRIDDEYIEPIEGVITPQIMDVHRKKLRVAVREALSPSPAMRPGTWCQWCPALEMCPTHVGLESVSDIFNLTQPEQIRRYYGRLIAAENLLKKARARMTALVEMNGPVELDNGKVLVVKERSRETLSKESIRRALGHGEGELYINQLRERGLLDETRYRELVQQVPESARKGKGR